MESDNMKLYKSGNFLSTRQIFDKEFINYLKNQHSAGAQSSVIQNWTTHSTLWVYSATSSENENDSQNNLTADVLNESPENSALTNVWGQSFSRTLKVFVPSETIKGLRLMIKN